LGNVSWLGQGVDFDSHGVGVDDNGVVEMVKRDIVGVHNGIEGNVVVHFIELVSPLQNLYADDKVDCHCDENDKPRDGKMLVRIESEKCGVDETYHIGP
jgi:hypothetical protein